MQLDNDGEPKLSRINGGLRKPELLPSPFSRGQLVLEHGYFEEDAMIFPDGQLRALPRPKCAC